MIDADPYNYDYDDEGWENESDFDIANEVYQDEVFEKFRMLAEIGTHADELISRLKNDRAPDFAKTTFIFDREQLDKAMPAIPRYVDVLIATQYRLKELSVSFLRDFRKDTHGIEVTFGLMDRHKPESELSTLIARRDDLRSPTIPLADKFTYPADPYFGPETTINFPTLSASDLRKLVASLLPLEDQRDYMMYDDWIQLPGNFEDVVENMARQDAIQMSDATYKLYDPIGKYLGTFSHHTFEGELISFSLDTPDDAATTHYEISLGLLPPPEDDKGDDFFGSETRRRVLNNDESPVMIHTTNNRTGKRSIPVGAGLDDLRKIDELLRNKPGLHEDPTIETYTEDDPPQPDDY